LTTKKKINLTKQKKKKKKKINLTKKKKKKKKTCDILFWSCLLIILFYIFIYICTINIDYSKIIIFFYIKNKIKKKFSI